MEPCASPTAAEIPRAENTLASKNVREAVLGRDANELLKFDTWFFSSLHLKTGVVTGQ